MVYKRLFYYIHERLVQIKKSKEPFGGISVIAVGDFYQPPPVKQRKLEILYKENDEYPVDCWLDFFKIVELEEIMRQRDDAAFATVLNSLRIRMIEEPLSEEAKTMLKECIRDGQDEVQHVYPTNDEANEYNLKMLQTNCEELIEITAEDYQEDKTTGKLTLRAKPFIRTRTDGLSASLLFSVNARVMLTININVEDGLVNGAMGHISAFDFGQAQERNRVEGIRIFFDSEDIGRLQGKKTPLGNEVLIQMIQEDIKEKNTTNVVQHQFPLKLAWACTAHKVQSMTTNSVVVNLDRTFVPGQA
ncbi:ATP-dependent DNA helicase PIF1-like [Saccostrea echinata]|uniref:ATP-dependent DNA helicase PIF1-like n=1 Tax=Saccostrea echinata TaxID=191078 RepID=UPI002A824A35|nr:ATP-dependent DNA helicase PIF1-like [Saccostrea echinata]